MIETVIFLKKRCSSIKYESGDKMDREMMNTKEVAEFLGIHEKQVYALIKAKRIPCTRVTGKWIFPRDLISQWIVDNARLGSKGETGERREGEGSLMGAGSNDPILDILLSRLTFQYPGLHIFSSSTGSTSGLRLLGEGVTDIAWCHLSDPKTGEYNTEHICSFFPGTAITIVHLFQRQLGLLLSERYSGKIKNIEDIAGSGARIVNRQEGSGTRKYLDYLLEEKEIDNLYIEGYGNAVNTHFEVGLSILSGRADAGIASIAVSRLLGLSFIPLHNESFDMVLKHSTFFMDNVQNLMGILKSDDFRDNVKTLGNYNFSESGKIIFASA
jgi:putative molybdopterin biosynthesis protein